MSYKREILKKVDLSDVAGALSRSKDPLKTFYSALKKRAPFPEGASVSDIQISKEFEDMLHDYHYRAFEQDGSGTGAAMYWLDQSPASNDQITKRYEVWYTKNVV